jgi:hypothetical protein
VVPQDLQTYFSVGAALSGTFIGLLFVAISLRYDAIFLQGFRNRATATSAFISLVDALAISVWALLPNIDVGYPAAVAGALCVVATIRTHVGPGGRRDTSTTLFFASLTGQTGQIILGGLVVATPHDHNLVEGFAYVVFYAVTVGLMRAWQLLLPERVAPVGQETPPEQRSQAEPTRASGAAVD